MIGRLLQGLDEWASLPDDSGRGRCASELLRIAEEQTVADGGDSPELRAVWVRWLEETGVPAYLGALPDSAARERWSRVCFHGIRVGRYDFAQMLAHRVREQGSTIYLEQWHRRDSIAWSYLQVERRARGYAAAFLEIAGEGPRIALYLQNSVEGACCDLACLAHDIFVTPLSIHFDVETLVFIFDRLRISVVVTDSDERARRLQEVLARARSPFTILVTRDSRLVEKGEARQLGEVVARLTPADVANRLDKRKRLELDDPCTVMFTSGSTGRPKGIVFTRFHLLSKRFARAAALPSVGRDEVLFCYLPLYHTFGRYLEMLGTLFWKGRYVFAGNPSAERLLGALATIRPTGLIGIPLRWSQIADRCRQAIEEAGAGEHAEEAFRSVVGDRLRWGLSAAGYLAPRDFRFLRRYGVVLCSGFGMTEATGGITMNPPEEYLDNTVGIPLPGMRIRLSDQGEMLIGGAYVARYLREEGENFEIEPPLLEGDEEWLPTGDLFEELEGGHVTIVDRIKDIYKNSRGQTVAPRRVEDRFHGVPGIKRTFLVGDHRDYNVLLIVPDFDDPVLAEARDEESRGEYFHQIVAAANRQLAPFERAVSFELLDRDFELDRGELTPKGSLKRKTIESHFESVIEGLYRRSEIELMVDGLRVRIPRWFFRDLGILEDDIAAGDARLVDRRRGLEMALRPSSDGVRWLVGSLEYRLTGTVVDLGVFARQPRVWAGNGRLMEFAPCKAGWDVSMAGVAGDVILPTDRESMPSGWPVDPEGIEDPELRAINRDAQIALFDGPSAAEEALSRLAARLPEADFAIAELIRSRFTALARHPEHRMRSAAYREVLLDEPRQDEGAFFFSFIESGLSFLDEGSIEVLASKSLGARRLEALRRRLLHHRRHYPWPSEGVAREQFGGILELLVRFVRAHPAYFNAVRQELAAWAVHRDDAFLASKARVWLEELDSGGIGSRVPEDGAATPASPAADSIVFDQDIPDDVRREMRELLLETAFLEKSVRNAFDTEFERSELGRGGVWVSRQRGGGGSRLHRVSVNTRDGRHFDLLVTLFRGVPPELAQETILWTLMVSGNPEGHRVMPRFGCSRPDLSAVSMEFIDGLTLGERIRQFAAARGEQGGPREIARWRRLFVRGLATIFRAFRASGESIVPGLLNPRNVVVPERDFHEDSMLLSLGGWRSCRSNADLFEPLLSCFFARTKARYPLLAPILSESWVLDACMEGLGPSRGREVLESLIEEAGSGSLDGDFVVAVVEYVELLDDAPYLPLPIDNAIDRYRRWNDENPRATTSARSELLLQLNGLYRLGRFGEMARYRLYRHTYFGESSVEIREAFDRLLLALRHSQVPATGLVELSDLQATLGTTADRQVFARLVFPQSRGPERFELVTFGESEYQRITLQTLALDGKGAEYFIREPVDAEEVGTLYRLFHLEKLPKAIGERDRHLIVVDRSDAIVAGLSFKMQGREVVHMDGVVVRSTLTRRGVAHMLLDDFVARLESIGVRLVKTGYMYPEFLESCGFEVDRRWGGLVRYLSTPEADLEHLEAGARYEG